MNADAAPPLAPPGEHADALRAEQQAAVDSSPAYAEALAKGVLNVGKLVRDCTKGEAYNHARGRKGALKPVTAESKLQEANKVRARMR